MMSLLSARPVTTMRHETVHTSSTTNPNSEYKQQKTGIDSYYYPRVYVEYFISCQYFLSLKLIAIYHGARFMIYILIRYI